MLIDELKKANVEAMKTRNLVIKNIIGILINKYMLVSIEKKAAGAVAGDAELVAIIQKTAKELSEEEQNYIKAGNEKLALEAKSQRTFIESFLPAMMNEEQIREVILSLEDKSVPSVMKHFKQNYSGKCDMKLVGDVLKSL